MQSNIRSMGRLHLLVELIIRMHRELNDNDAKHYREAFGEFIKEDSLHYCYRLKSEGCASKLEKVGLCIHKLLDQLKGDYKHSEGARNLGL